MNNNNNNNRKFPDSTGFESMPRCCLDGSCKHPTLAVREGHKCRLCRQPVHSIGCSILDDSCDAHENLVCLLCDAIEKAGSPPTKNKTLPDDNRKPPARNRKRKNTAGPTGSTSEASGSPRSHQNRKGSLKKPPPTNQEQPRARKIKKTAAQKSFVLQAEHGTPDPLVLKTVCFNTQDGKYGSKLAKHLYPNDPSQLIPSLKKIQGTYYLFGTKKDC